MATEIPFPLEGGCACRKVKYRIETAPLIVNSCHCRWCQRETGTAFAQNALIEHDRVTILTGEPISVPTPSQSGLGQVFFRCPACFVTLWSIYAGVGPAIRMIRVGTLDQPDYLPPKFHIFTTTKQPWVILAPETPAFEENYDLEQYWSAESIERFRSHQARFRGDSGAEQGVGAK